MAGLGQLQENLRTSGLPIVEEWDYTRRCFRVRYARAASKGSEYTFRLSTLCRFTMMHSKSAILMALKS
jgi:hypothetical protein